MLSSAQTVCPDSMSFAVSIEKVEKVLNPPQKPVSRNALIQIGASSRCAISNMPNPRTAVALMFAMNVPNGKWDRLFPIQFPTPNRRTEPKPPPIKMAAILSIGRLIW